MPSALLGFVTSPSPASLPFLHFTVWVAAVVDEPGLIAHPVAVDHHPTIQVQAVVVTVIMILLDHPVPKEERKK